MATELATDLSPSQDSIRWRTFHPQRTVLVVVRTLTSAIRLLEALPVFSGDHRIKVLFTVDTRSKFSTGAAELVRGLPAHVIPWEQASMTDCDLVLAASEKIDLRSRRAVPMIVLPHGIGFHKHVPDVDGSGTRVSGVVAPEVLRHGRVSLLVTHPDQERHLAELNAETIGRTVLGGDTSFDLLTDSAPLRGYFRSRLGLADDQKLVLVSSTWRGQSLLGTRPELLDRLLGGLPADEFRVAAVAHPNAWAWHGGWELRRILHTALRSGLLLVDPTQGWHAAMVASDLVIGDHGSLSLYAAATGTPLLLAAFGEEVVDGTPMARLGHTTHRLDQSGSLRGQVERAMVEHDPRTAAAVAETVFSAPGEAQRLLRTWCYDALGLPEPDTQPQSMTAPDPAAGLPSVYAFDVIGEVRDATVVLRRHPVPVRAHQSPLTSAQHRHLSVDVRERNVRLYADASTIVRSEVTKDVGEWLATAIERWPGSRMTGHATADGCSVLIRDGRRFDLHAPEWLRDAGLLTSALYTLLLAGHNVPGAFELRVGDRTGRIAAADL